MSKPTPDLTEFHRLLAKLVDDCLSDAERARLETQMAESSAARLRYFHYLDLHAELMARLDRSAITDTPEPLPSLHPLAPSAKSPVLGFLGRISRHVPGGEFTVGSLLVLVVVAAFWGLSQAIMYPNLGGQDLAESSAPLGRRGDTEVGGEGNPVATITASEAAQWSADPDGFSPLAPDKGRGAGGEGSAITQGQPLSIQSGLVELQLKQGTTLYIEGPADWKIDGDNSATLTRGKLFAKIPQQAIGFTLETPSAKIVDLGTEFGAVVSGSGDVQLSVFRGKVESRLKQRNERPLQIRAGESAKIDAKSIHMESIPFTESPFARLRALDSNEVASNDPVALFADNFDSPETVAEISPTAETRQLRQSGVLRRLSYIEKRWDNRPNSPQDDRTSLVSGQGGGRLRLLAKRNSSVTVSPNGNFRAEHRGGTRFVVECDVSPVNFVDGNEHPTSDGWAGVIVGCSSQVTSVGQPGGVSLLIRRDGKYTVFDGTRGEYSVAANGALPSESAPANRVFHARVAYELRRFGGPEPAEVRIDINDVRIAEFTSHRPLLENYILLQSFTTEVPIWSEFDNLSISAQELPIRETAHRKQNVD